MLYNVVPGLHIVCWTASLMGVSTFVQTSAKSPASQTMIGTLSHEWWTIAASIMLGVLLLRPNCLTLKLNFIDSVSKRNIFICDSRFFLTASPVFCWAYLSMACCHILRLPCLTTENIYKTTWGRLDGKCLLMRWTVYRRKLFSRGKVKACAHKWRWLYLFLYLLSGRELQFFLGMVG